jgi:hypothetical protein
MSLDRRFCIGLLVLGAVALWLRLTVDPVWTSWWVLVIVANAWSRICDRWDEWDQELEIWEEVRS